MKQPFGSMPILALFFVGLATSVFGNPVPPWIEPNPSRYTLWWSYDFNDGTMPPTASGEGGHSSVPTDPVWTLTGVGDSASISGGMLGIHNASQPSQADLFIFVPNGYDASQIKYFWFAYDFVGQMPTPTAGTTNAGHIVSGITYSGNTIGSHIEGYITINPQPQDEWLNIHLTAGIGGTTMIDNLQIGSSCIPEPVSVGMLGVGGVFSMLWRNQSRKRRRKSMRGVDWSAIDSLALSVATATPTCHQRNFSYRYNHRKHVRRRPHY